MKVEEILRSFCIVKTDNTEINILQLIRNDQVYEKFTKYLIQITETHLSFWDNFLLNEPPLKKIYKISRKILQETQSLNSKWDNSCKGHCQEYPKLYLLYGLFNFAVKNKAFYSEGLLKQYFNVMNSGKNDNNEDELSSENILSFDNIVIRIKGEYESFGMIQSISQSVEKHLGYSYNSFKSANVTKIMSPFFQLRHAGFIKKYYESGITKLINKNITLFMMHREGYIIPACILIKYHPFITNGVEFIGLLRPLKNYCNYLVVEEDGTVDSFTQEIGILLNIQPYNRTRLIKIGDVCKEFENIHKIMNYFLRKDMNHDIKLEKNELDIIRKKKISQLEFDNVTESNRDNIKEDNELLSPSKITASISKQISSQGSFGADEVFAPRIKDIRSLVFRVPGKAKKHRHISLLKTTSLNISHLNSDNEREFRKLYDNYRADDLTLTFNRFEGARKTPNQLNHVPFSNIIVTKQSMKFKCQIIDEIIKKEEFVTDI